jgi:Integrase core domain
MYCLCCASVSLAHARQELEAWRHDYNHFWPHSSLGNRTPAEMGTGSIGKPYWGHAPNTVVAIKPSDGHHNGPRLYSQLVETSGSDKIALRLGSWRLVGG